MLVSVVSSRSAATWPRNPQLVFHNHGLDLKPGQEYYYAGLILFVPQATEVAALTLAACHDHLGPLYHQAVEQLDTAVFHAWKNSDIPMVATAQAVAMLEVIRKNLYDRTGKRIRLRK